MIRSPRRHPILRSAALACLAATVSLGACEDPFDLEADRPTDNLGFQVWALNGTPDEFPTALNVPTATLVRPDGAGSFDIAFDVDVDGRLLVIPMRLVVSPVLGGRTVHFIQTPAVYDQVLSAPASGWEQDSTIALDPGATFLVRVFATQCQFQLRQYIYAKFIVDSIIPAERRARLRGKLNPNCGFRSFQDGIPEF